MTTYTYSTVIGDFNVTQSGYIITFKVDNTSNWTNFNNLAINSNSSIAFTNQVLTDIFLTQTLIDPNNIKYVDGSASGSDITGLALQSSYSLYQIMSRIIYNILNNSGNYSNISNAYIIDNTNSFKSFLKELTPKLSSATSDATVSAKNTVGNLLVNSGDTIKIPIYVGFNLNNNNTTPILLTIQFVK